MSAKRRIAGTVMAIALVFAASQLYARPAEEETEAKPKKAAKVAAQPYKGPKQRIAVMDFTDSTDGKYHGLGSGMAEMLTTALHETGRFIVVERQAIEDVLTEQNFGMTGRVQSGTEAKVGRVLGAQLLIRGTVTEFEMTEQNRSGGLSLYGVSLGGSGASAHVGVDVRIYNADTGVVLESHRSEAKAKSGGLNLGVSVHGIDFNGADFKKTPLGKATREAIEDMVDFIVAKMKDVPWQGRVMKVSDDGLVYVNAGAEAGISPGDAYAVFRASEELIDPETGLSLGSEKTRVGEIQISAVEPAFSKAIVVSGAGFQRNDIIQAK